MKTPPHLASGGGGEACSGVRVGGGRVRVGSVKVPGTGLEGVEIGWGVEVSIPAVPTECGL
jgi:hypothetical protein